MFGTPTNRPRRDRPTGTPSFNRGTPSIFSERDRRDREPLTPSVRSSRLGGPSRSQIAPASLVSSAGETARTGRVELEGHERRVWSKDDRHEVTSAGSLPKEVQHIIKNSDFVAHPIMGHVDPDSGFAFVATPSVCVAWNYQKRTNASPTTYSFPAPPPSYGTSHVQPPILASLHHSESGEPGMILVSSTGEIRFWESMSLALANADRYQRVQLDLGEDSFAERIWTVDTHNLLITTSSSTAFRVAMINQGGRVNLAVSNLQRPGRIYGARSDIFSGPEDKSGINAVVSTSGQAFLMAGRTLQRWNIAADGIKFVREDNLYDAIGGTLFEEEWEMTGTLLELIDLVALGQEELAVLVSYSEQQSTSISTSNHNAHAIVIFTIQGRSSTLTISRTIPVSYLAHPDPRTLDAPRLLVPYGSFSAFIRFADVIVMVSLLPSDPYEDVIALKNSGRNAFIEAGCKRLSSTTIPTGAASVIVMPAIGGLMTIEVLRSVSLSRPGRQGPELSPSTARLKSKMEQAVFFGDRTENPISFELPAGFQGDLAAAAEAVSTEVISSMSTYMFSIYEIKPQLADRAMRLKELMSFVRSNGFMGLLPQITRRRLSADAEKVKAAIQLWDHQDQIMEQMHTHPHLTLLRTAIGSCMSHLQGSVHDDVVRNFFRYHTQHLDTLLEAVYTTLKSVIEAIEPHADPSQWICEANNIFIIVLRAASAFREHEAAIYEIERSRPNAELWTARDAIVDALEYLFELTQASVRNRTRDIGSAVDQTSASQVESDLSFQQGLQATLKYQMTQLAAAICINMEDKVRTQSTRQMDGGADPQKGLALNERWQRLKPSVIRPLAAIDRVAEAYQLAEHHSDFPTLVFLCHDPVAGRGQNAIQHYIERFKDEFAFVLYQWYIDEGHLHALLSQDEVYGHLLTRFFEDTGHPELAWLHHIASKRYGEAATALIKADAQAKHLGQKHLIGSISKLAAVADLESKGDAWSRRKQLADVDDELDLVKTQNTLRDAILASAPTAPGDRRLPIDRYTEHYLTVIGQRQSFKRIFRDLANQLIDGKALDMEGFVDVLTLKDNASISSRDPATALDRLIRDDQLPEGRKQVALLSAWRRVFVRDDWLSIANTSGRSDEAQRNMLRRTTAYQTIQAINIIPEFPRQFILTPSAALDPPLAAELAARFPEWPATAIKTLLEDHEDEIILLNTYIVEADLNRRVREVSELVERDMKSGWDEDVAM